VALSKYKQEDISNHINLYKKWTDIDIQSGERPPNILDFSKHKKRVVIWTGPAWEPWNKQKVDEGMAGSETWAAYIAREFVKKGFRTTIYNDLLSDSKDDVVLDSVLDENGNKIGDVIYRDHTKIQEDVQYDVIDYFIASRSTEPLKLNIHSLRNYVMIHDIWLSPDKSYDVMTWRIQKYAYLSEWHKRFIMSHHGIISDKMFLTANGQDFDLYKDVDKIVKKNQSVYSSSPDRGLYQLLKMLPDIREKIPDFELVVAYGFFNWESMAKMRGDTEGLKFIEEIKALMDQPGVKYVGRISKKQLAQYEMESKIWLYPSWFTETFCITAVAAGLSKNTIVSTDLAGLQTTVGDAGVLLSPEGLSRNGEYPKSYTDRFVEEAIKMLSDEEYRLEWSEKAYNKMKEYSWSNIADEWIKQFGIK
jgi:glycosyltransferase involved in cell wall biosynthesis